MLHALGLFGAVVISFSAILVRLADVSPTTAAFFRPLYALPFIVLLCWATRHGCPRSARQRWICVGAGVLMGVSATLGNYSIGYVGAGLATVLANTQVVFVALVAWLVLRERPSLNAFFAAPLVFAGVALVTGIGRPDAYGEEPVSGVLFGLGNAIVYATFLLLFRPALRGLTIPTGPLLDATLGATAATFLLGVATDPAFDLMPSWPAHGWLLLLAVGPQVVGWWVIIGVLPRLPALDTSVLLLLQPMFTVVWGRLLFEEYFSPVQWGGVALVLLGIAMIMASGKWRRRHAKRPHPPK